MPDLITEECTLWFVWTKKGRVPRYLHSSRESAQTEAARLARLNPGRKYIVLEGVAKVHVPAAEACPAVMRAARAA